MKSMKKVHTILSQKKSQHIPNYSFYFQDFLDYIFYTLVGFLVLLIFIATLHDIRMEGYMPEKDDDIPFLLAFSLKRNWLRLIRTSSSLEEREMNFKFLNALRFLSMYCVVGGHALLFYAVFPIINTEYMEQVRKTTFRFMVC